MSQLKEPEQTTGGIRLDERALGGGGLRADTPLTSGNAAAASAPMAFGFSAAELQDAEVMMRRKLWRDTAAKLGFAERQVELMAETIDPAAVHTAIRELVSRKKVLEGKGANFAHLKQLRAYPEFNKWYEQLATFERMEPGAARAAIAGYLRTEIRQWLTTRARELYDNDGQIDAGEWALLVRDAELFWIVEGVAATEALTACRVAAGDPLWAPPPPDESAELRARELRQELEARETVLREEAQRNAQASAALEEQTLALQSMERKAAEMMAQAAIATEAAERKASERKGGKRKAGKQKASVAVPASPLQSPSPPLTTEKTKTSFQTKPMFILMSVAALAVLGVVLRKGGESDRESSNHRAEGAPSHETTGPSLSVSAPDPPAPVVTVIPSSAAPPNPAPPPLAPSPIPNTWLRTGASTQAAQWEEYTFGSMNLIDGDTRSSWQPVQTGKGPGEWFMLKLAKARTVAGIEIWNGFQRHDRLGELYHLNSRIKTATLELSDGAKRPLEFDDVEEKSTFLFTAPHVGIKWVKVTVNTVYTGDRWDDLAVSEVSLLGVTEAGE